MCIKQVKLSKTQHERNILEKKAVTKMQGRKAINDKNLRLKRPVEEIHVRCLPFVNEFHALLSSSSIAPKRSPATDANRPQNFVLVKLYRVAKASAEKFSGWQNWKA